MMLSGCIKNHQSLEPGYCAISHLILHPMQPVQNDKSVQDKKFQVSLLYLNNQNPLILLLSFFFSDVIGFHSSRVHFIFLFLQTLFLGSRNSIVAYEKGSTCKCDRTTESTILEKSSEIIESNL